MKKIFTQFCLFAFFCITSVNLNAQTFLINDAGSHEVMSSTSSSKTKTFTISNPIPAAILEFSNSQDKTWATGGVQVTATYNDGSSSDLGTYKNGSHSYNFDRKIVTSLSFKGTGTLKKTISNLKLSAATYADAPAHTVWEPTAVVGSNDSYGETTMEWSDVAPFTLTLSGEGASQFTCNITNNSSVGNYGTATISAIYKHNVAGVDSATLTLTNGTTTYEIALVGTTTKKDQTLTWASDLLAGKLPVGKEVIAPATALSGLALTYTSSNDSVIAIINDGTGIKALAAGQATIYAYQAGDGEWNEVADSLEFVVTEKKIQYIHWTDNLTRLKTDSEPIELTATAQLLLDAETGETIDNPERTALITYQSNDSSVVSVNDNILTVVGEGETTVTATLPGDDVYEEAVISMPVRVRVPSMDCEEYVLNAPDEVSKEYSVVWQKVIYEPAAFTGPGHILTFEARKNMSTAVGDIEIQQFVNGGWHNIDIVMPGNDWTAYQYVLDRNATKIRFYNGYGSYYRYFKNVLVTQATYLETNTPAIVVDQSIIGDEITRTIAVQYSNLSAGVTVHNVSDKVTLSTSELNTECGKHGEEIITLTIRPTEIGTIQDTVTIYDEATGLNLVFPVTVHTQRKTQTITWEDSIDVIYATDDITLTATAVNAIHYTSSDSAIAYVDEANKLIIKATGNVTITAHAAESETYNPAELSKNITILHAVPVILALPTVEPVAYGVQLTNDMLVGGEANVDGAFAWNTDLEQKLVPGEYNLPIQFIPDNPIFGVIDTTVVVTVLKGKQSIVWEQDFSEVYVTDTLYLYATALTELYYENTDWDMANLDENQLTFNKAGELRVDAIAKEDDFYYGDTVSVVITVKPEEIDSLVTTYPTATSIVYGQLLGESLLEGGVATIEGEFKWADGNVLLPVGTHYRPAIFAPAESERYADVEFMVEVVVAQAPQTIEWVVEMPVVLELGDTIELTATATSELEIAYELDVEGVVEIDGDYMIAVGEGVVNVTARQDGVDEFGDANYLSAEPVTYTITVVEKNVNNSLESVEANANAARKIVRNGQLYIIRGEHTYNALGNLIR